MPDQGPRAVHAAEAGAFADRPWLCAAAGLCKRPGPRVAVLPRARRLRRYSTTFVCLSVAVISLLVRLQARVPVGQVSLGVDACKVSFGCLDGRDQRSPAGSLMAAARMSLANPRQLCS
jgi:hypothetical protein